MSAITKDNQDAFGRALSKLAERSTAYADQEFDEHGKVVQGGDPRLADTIVVERGAEVPEPAALFEDDQPKRKASTRRTKKKTRRKK